MDGDGVRAETLESLPPASLEHGWLTARRPLVIPLGSSCLLHVLPAGSVLGPGSEGGLSRVLGGRVQLRSASSSTKLLESCACFGGEVCPRKDCKFRISTEPSGLASIDLDGDSPSFETQRFEVIAETKALIIDALVPNERSSTRHALGAMRLPKLFDASEVAHQLWLDDDPEKEEKKKENAFFSKTLSALPSTPPPPSKQEVQYIDNSEDLELSRAELIRLDDGEALGVAGVDEVLAELETRLRLPLAAPADLLEELGVKPVRGVVFWGKPGCGKTLLATQIAKALDSNGEPTIVAAPQLLDKYLGGSEANIRKAFFGSASDDEEETNSLMTALKTDSSAHTEKKQKKQIRCVVVDEIDAIAASRSSEAASGADRARDSIVNQLLSILCGTTKDDDDTFLVLATTNRLDLIDEALLRPGRFEIQIEIKAPTASGRLQILHLKTKSARENGRLTPRAAAALEELSHKFPDGTTGASIAAIVRLAASFALERFFHQDSNQTDTDPLRAAALRRKKAKNVQIDLPDFERAVSRVLSVEKGA